MLRHKFPEGQFSWGDFPGWGQFFREQFSGGNFPRTSKMRSGYISSFTVSFEFSDLDQRSLFRLSFVKVNIAKASFSAVFTTLLVAKLVLRLYRKILSYILALAQFGGLIYGQYYENDLNNYKLGWTAVVAWVGATSLIFSSFISFTNIFMSHAQQDGGIAIFDDPRYVKTNNSSYNYEKNGFVTDY